MIAPSTAKRGITLILLIGLLLWPVTRNGFVYDDDLYVLRNRQVGAGLTARGLAWAFGTFEAANWHPITWASHMLDVDVWGMRPAGHHLTNLIIHALNTGLLLVVVETMTGALWAGVLTAALFGVHPLHIESVAWISERKDLLSGFFLLLTLLAYVRHARRPGTARLGAVYVLFAIGLMAKPMAVSLPLLLLLMDYWPLGRLGIRGEPCASPEVGRRAVGLGILWEKTPMMALSALSSWVTLLAQSSGGAIHQLDTIPLGQRLGNAALSYLVYLRKTIWPIDLAVFYPHPGDSLRTAAALASAGVLCAMTVLSLRVRRSLPYITAGWWWYLIALVPVIGLVQAGTQAMADRYTYLPLIGPFLALAYGLRQLSSHDPRWRALAAVTVVACLILMSSVARRQTAYWRDNSALFGHAVAVTSGNWMAHNNLGTALFRQGKVAEAAGEYRRALSFRPDYWVAHHNLANILASSGKADEAIEHYRSALASHNGDAEAYLRLGELLSTRGDVGGALAAYRGLLRVFPGHREAQRRLEDLLGTARGQGGEGAPPSR